jgi:ankyrin repeat protein
MDVSYLYCHDVMAAPLSGRFICRQLEGPRAGEHVLLPPRSSLVNHRSIPGYTALDLACSSGCKHAVETLLNVGANPTLFSDITVNGCLHMALRSYQSDHKSRDVTATVELLLHRIEAMHDKRCIGHTVDIAKIVNQKNTSGRTALHEACRTGCLDAVMKLARLGADVDALDQRSSTPLHEAVSSGHFAIVNVLLQRHADSACQNIDGLTPLHLLCQKPSATVTVMEYMLTTWRATSRQELTYLLTIRDKAGWQPLHHACCSGNVSLVAILIKAGARTVDTVADGASGPDAPDTLFANYARYMNALHVSCYCGVPKVRSSSSSQGLDGIRPSAVCAPGYCIVVSGPALSAGAGHAVAGWIQPRDTRPSVTKLPALLRDGPNVAHRALAFQRCTSGQHKSGATCGCAMSAYAIRDRAGCQSVSSMCNDMWQRLPESPSRKRSARCPSAPFCSSHWKCSAPQVFYTARKRKPRCIRCMHRTKCHVRVGEKKCTYALQSMLPQRSSGCYA